MKDYAENKSPKDPKLCQLIRKAITVNRKAIGLEFDDVAEELGLQPGTLENKLKPSYANGDLTLTEFVHFLELTNDMGPLEYIASNFDMLLVRNDDVTPTVKKIGQLADKAMMESSDVFRSAKEALEDGNISEDEKERLLKELRESNTANFELEQQLKHLPTPPKDE
ncbi:phage regulatory CII family protein [Sulfurimonas sp. HSL-1716]|uniref:phage regulatory CII family protein n=1 Tax=Hydrocurvibacter sulfurireducens TaxID=3131937 RepID=UPI0031F82C7B